MNRKRSLIRQSNVFKTILISSLLPCFLATVILAVVFLPMISRASRDNDESYGKNLLYVTSSCFEELFDSFAGAVSIIENNNWIHPLFLDSLIDKAPGYDRQEDVRKELLAASLRGNYYLFSFRFYEDDGLYTSNGVYLNQPFYEQKYPELEYRFFTSGTKQPVVSSIAHEEGDFLLYQAPFRVISTGQYRGEVNIFVRSEVLGKRLLEAVGPDVAAFRLLDAQGNTVWEYRAGDSGEKTVTLTQTAGSGQFAYCVELPESVYSRTRRDTVPVVLVSLVVSMIISMVLCWFLSRLTYRPIQQFLGKVAGQTMRSSNDIEVLERAFESIRHEKRAVEDSLEELRPIALQKMLGALLDGSAFLEASAEYQLENCGVQFDYEWYNVIAMTAPFSRLNDTEYTAQLATEILLDALKSQLFINAYLYYDGSDHYRIIVNYHSWEQLQTYISMLSSNVKKYFHSNEIMDGISFGVGQAVESAEELYRANDQADTAMYAAIMNRLEQPMFYRELAPEMSYDYYYPMSEELMLSRAITNCNSTGAKQLLYAIIEENRRNPKLNPQCLQLLYMDLSSTVARSGQNLNIRTLPVSTKESYLSLDEICRRVETMIDHICNQIMDKRSRMIDPAEQQMLDYIDQHIFDSDLSLSSVGAAFDRSAGYVSNMFREHRDTNFNNYVNRARIMRAMQLMAEQGLDSNSVFPLVGYTNLTTFRRNFSKFAKQNPGTI